MPQQVFSDLTNEELIKVHLETLKNVSKLDNAQQAKKIQQNALYGALSNEHFRFFDIRLAEAVTQTGQLTIRWVEKRVNQYINTLVGTTGVNYVIAVDTDSVYLELARLVEMWQEKEPTLSHTDIVNKIDHFAKTELAVVIEKAFNELAAKLGVKNRVEMKREAIADAGFWTGKKRYALNMIDLEGVRFTEPKMKIMGLEVARSTTPSFFRERLKQLYKIVLTKTKEDVIAFIEQTRLDTYKQHYSLISFTRGVSDVAKYDTSQSEKWHSTVNVDKNGKETSRFKTDDETGEILLYAAKTPIHVRGALIFNNLVHKLGLEKTVQLIKEGDKVKFCYLKLPNQTRENVISFPEFIPPEMGLDKHIDYDTQFEKGFLAPAMIVTDACRWAVSEPTLEGLW